MTTLRIAFFGTPSFAAQILEDLIERNVSIVAVVSQPDRPKGRSLRLAPTPVKEVALAKLSEAILFQPEKASNPVFLDQLAALSVDLYVVVAFGQILPQKLLQIPRLGCINVHASLLPKYRGAAPIQRALLNGDRETGISIQKMVRELDAGDVICKEKIAISPEMTYGELEAALCALSKPLLFSALRAYEKGIPPAEPQDPSQVTFAPKVTAEEAQIHWDKDAATLHNQIRAFNPRPGAWCWVEWNGEKKRLKILRARVAQSPDNKEFYIPCGRGFLQLLEVQMEGKPRCLAADWLRGARVPPKFF
ncbi:MAG TPA: methionyl-tRNA formyltransferase [Chlamydiales bacterium]|nr:methionyl-tRNA formyltransferase [Chlamydiales bacterium]